MRLQYLQKIEDKENKEQKPTTVTAVSEESSRNNCKQEQVTFRNQEQREQLSKNEVLRQKSEEAQKRLQLQHRQYVINKEAMTEYLRGKPLNQNILKLQNDLEQNIYDGIDKVIDPEKKTNKSATQLKKCQSTTLTKRQLEQVEMQKKKEAKEKYWTHYLISQNKYLNSLNELVQTSEKKFHWDIKVKEKFLFEQLAEPQQFYNSFLQPNDLKVSKLELHSQTQYKELQQQRKLDEMQGAPRKLTFQRKQEKRVQIKPHNNLCNSIVASKEPSERISLKSQNKEIDGNVNNEYIVDKNIMQLKDFTQIFTDNIKDMHIQKTRMSHRANLTWEQKKFFQVLKKGNFEQIRQVVREYPEFIDLQDDQQQTAMHWAVKRCDLQALEMLLFDQANYTIKDILGRTPKDLAKTLNKENMYNYLSFIEQILQPKQQIVNLQEFQKIRINKTSSRDIKQQK